MSQDQQQPAPASGDDAAIEQQHQQVEQNAETTDASAATDQPQEGAPAEGDDRKPSGGGFQKRIAKLTREKYEILAEHERLKQRLEAVERQAKPAEAADKDVRPEDFDSYEAYLEAKADQAVQRRLKEVERQREQQTVSETRQRALIRSQAEFRASAEELSTEVSDFYDVAQSVHFDPAIGQALLKNDQGARLLYYLGKNPEVLEQVAERAAGDPERAAIQLARLEGKANELIQKRTRSAAPPPVKPGTAGGGGGAKSPEEMTADEWMQHEIRRLTERAKKGLN